MMGSGSVDRSGLQHDQGAPVRRIVVTEFVSLDGVMEDPGGAEGTPLGGWGLRFPDTRLADFKLAEIRAHEAMLLGRATYEGFAAAWPGVHDERGFADRMNGMPKYVVSRTLEAASWDNSTILRGPIEHEIAGLLARPGGDILVVGSATLVRSLMAARLVDELRLTVFPIVLGQGARLFGPSAGPAVMTLGDLERLVSGTLILTYHPAGAHGEPATPTTRS